MTPDWAGERSLFTGRPVCTLASPHYAAADLPSFCQKSPSFGCMFLGQHLLLPGSGVPSPSPASHPPVATASIYSLYQSLWLPFVFPLFSASPLLTLLLGSCSFVKSTLAIWDPTLTPSKCSVKVPLIAARTPPNGRFCNPPLSFGRQNSL